MQGANTKNDHKDCKSDDLCMTGEAIATTLGTVLVKKAPVNKFSPASLRPWLSVIGKGLSAGNTAKTWGRVAADLNDLTYNAAINDINWKQQSQTLGPTGRQCYGSLINWGRVDWGPYDSLDMNEDPHNVFFNLRPVIEFRVILTSGECINEVRDHLSCGVVCC